MHFILLCHHFNMFYGKTFFNFLQCFSLHEDMKCKEKYSQLSQVNLSFQTVVAKVVCEKTSFVTMFLNGYVFFVTTYFIILCQT